MEVVHLMLDRDCVSYCRSRASRGPTSTRFPTDFMSYLLGGSWGLLHLLITLVSSPQSI